MADGELLECEVSEECLQELLDFFIKSVYKARNIDRRYEVIHKRCIHLVGRDYKIDVIDNKHGQLCAHYPSELIVIERELEEGEVCPHSTESKKNFNDTAVLRDLIPSARFARCRSRFVMPVILYRNKNICRSSTLSSMAELYGRSGMDWIFTLPSAGYDTDEKTPASSIPTSHQNGQGTSPGTSGGSPGTSQGTTTGAESSSNTSESDWVLLNKVRGQDVQLLKALRVDLICDLMVEKKKLKYGLYVCSSEKVDKWARYADFSIASMPYPGCEFFKDYRDNGYNAVTLKFDWSQGFVDAELTVPDQFKLAVDNCHQYQDWDLVEITQNYLKMLLRYLVNDEGGGVLVHCISGWDRTPLFVSLLRLSLWADGAVHRSLSASEILYFTLAYDWLIYGHQFKERHDKGEEVLYFCFDFLKYITSEDYSTLNEPIWSKSPPTASEASPSSMPRPILGNSVRRPRPKVELQPFEIHPSPSSMGGSFELGESWVGVSSVSVSHLSTSPRESHSSTPEHRPQVESWQQFSPERQFSPTSLGQDSPVTRLSPDTGSSHRHPSHSPSPSVSLRSRRLSNVRELFVKAFRTSVLDNSAPASTGSSLPGGGTLAGITGFISKIASSVMNNS